MKKLLSIALFFVLLSCAGHLYLAKRAYQLTAGLAETSAICNINDKINCDQALLSPYAKVFNISLSSFGFALYFIICVLLIVLLKFSLNSRWKNFLFYMSAVGALSSVGMAIISLIQSLYCPVCWSLYLFSFIITACLFFTIKNSLISPVKFAISTVTDKSSYILAGFILLISIFIHANFVNLYGLKNQAEIVNAVLRDWQTAPPVTINKHALIKKGAGDILLVEFADFLCPNCKHAQPAIKKFLKTFPNVQFQFYAYPLDGNCNEAVSYKGSGLSCELSKALICAKDKAWKFHDFFFDNQKSFISAQGDDTKIQSLFDEILQKNQLDKNNFNICMQDKNTLEQVKKSAKAGSQHDIQGTPTFFINGKQLSNYPQLFLILSKIYQYLK